MTTKVESRKSRIYCISYKSPLDHEDAKQFIVANSNNEALSHLADFYSMGRNQFGHYVTNVKIMELQEDYA